MYCVKLNESRKMWKLKSQRRRIEGEVEHSPVTKSGKSVRKEGLGLEGAIDYSSDLMNIISS